ncbi:lactate-binding periplasmic protein [Thalassobacillus devorans]|uniref:Lactate-binding periplasmic protein n=1 Tax=Thalassobacillus devorans TaxID=279813 RepID=A0ABQ1P2C1_9BACI|nr:TRAP transporter substrate-binding protein DctP [Thalassobacillus devorans]NIK28027.1 TRAP-type C4-dicarboxylate transport system substrate-binding protein [Thalassobacillus devorans]GGC89479.1 lactate-binding periplasmic protein [Thalassobacillus devorans]
MRKLNWLPIVFSLVLVLAACGGDEKAGGESSDETITLRAATGLSAQHGWWSDTMVPWMEKVEELTDGQVQFETYTGGELVSVPDEGDAVLNGTVDIALVLPIYQPDQFPMAEVTMLPLAHSDTLIGSNAWKALLNSDVELKDGQTYQEMMFTDFKVFPVSTTQEYSISTTGKEFDSVSDVKGTSLRTPSRIHEVYSDNVGINSVTMPAVEMYDALSRGSFEGSYYSIADWSGYGFQDLFRYTLTGINFGHFNSFIGMSQQKWEDMPENVQEAMEQANEEVFKPGAEEWINRSEELIEQNKEDGGKFVEFSSLDQEVQEVFTTGIEDTWMNYANMLEEQGLPGNKLIKLWRDLIVEEGGDVPDGLKNIE